MPNSVDEILHQVPEEQRRLLERMMQLKLVEHFHWHDADGRWLIAYTKDGRDFLGRVKAVVSPDSGQRWSSSLALIMLARGEVVIGGYKRD